MELVKSTSVIAALALTCFTFLLLAPTSVRVATAASSSITISPTSGIVGSGIVVSGEGYAPNTNLILNWGSDNVSWTFGGNPTQTSGIKAIPVQWKLTSVQTNASGSFTAQVTAPVDNGGKHVVQAYSANGTALPGEEIFTLEPSFKISSSSGASESPITIFATGLGIGVYSTNYHVMWDNKYLGYMTAVTTHGTANATIYAVGSIGTHYIDIYQGYPGAAYLNPDQNPSFGNWYPPYLPFQTNYTITSEPFTQTSSASATGTSAILPILSLALVVGGLGLIPVMAFQKKKNGLFWSAIGRIRVVVIIAGLLIAGTGAYFVYTHYSTSTKTLTASYVPQVSAVIPEITVPQTNATSGPRITVIPNVATVGTMVNVTGSGFAPNSQLPVSWSTRVGNNLKGFNIVEKPLKNVTSGASGSFTFAMQVPSDLEGDHFISVGNLTLNSNATLYIQRDAMITPDEGPVGTEITIQLLGTGWDFNTNIVVIDYDNSYVGFACGFNSQGNITVTIPAVGAPGLHTIDLYPSIYLGPPEPSQIMVYRYPIMTPYDQPEKVPSFHFSFLITSENSTTTTSSSISSIVPAVLGFASLSLGSLYLISQLHVVMPRRFARFTN
jgi:hypothetical protein